MNEREAYLVLHKASGIKVGDTVKVVRAADSFAHGWADVWMGLKSDMIGKTCIVQRDDGANGFALNDWHYPFFVLEKIASAPEKSTIDQVIDEGDFGCRAESVRKLAHAIIKECKKG